MLKIFKKQKREYIEWKDYKKHIDFVDTFNWQQSVRKESIKNF